MLTKLIRSLIRSKNSIKGGGNYYRERIKNSYRHREKYLELRYKASLKNKIEADQIDNQLPLTNKGIRKEFGNPKFCIKNGQSIATEILFYRTHLGKFQAHVEFHFYKDRLFFYTYSFNNVSELYRKEIINLLKEKYLKGQRFNYKDQIISDGQSLINVEASFNFSIHYFSKNHEEVFNVFSDRIQQIRQEKFRSKDNQQELVYPGL